jgi:hypothetical protein
MKEASQHIFKAIIFGLLNLVVISTFSQSTIKVSADNFVDSLKQSSDTIIEIRINRDNQKHLIQYPSTYIYFKNIPEFHYKFCGKKIDNKAISKTECNNDWQILFDFVTDHWTTIKNEKLMSNSIIKSDGTTEFSSPSHFDIIEVLVHTKDKTEKIIIRNDYFLPSVNKNYRLNILTKTFLFMSLIENSNIEKNNNR